MSETSKPNDLHYTKKSHFSVPMAMTKDMEWHFENGDAPHKDGKMGDKTIVAMPMEITSKDTDGTRYRQTGAPFNPLLPKGFTYKTKQ